MNPFEIVYGPVPVIDPINGKIGIILSIRTTIKGDKNTLEIFGFGFAEVRPEMDSYEKNWNKSLDRALRYAQAHCLSQYNEWNVPGSQPPDKPASEPVAKAETQTVAKEKSETAEVYDPFLSEHSSVPGELQADDLILNFDIEALKKDKPGETWIDQPVNAKALEDINRDRDGLRIHTISIDEAKKHGITKGHAFLLHQYAETVKK
jgi:hypothetical protein